MKKTLVAAVCFCALSSESHSQFRHDFGEVSGSEINMKKCSFDPEADAVVLVSEAYANPDDQYQLVTSSHRRLKILNEKGFDNANVSIPFASSDQFEYIDDIHAVTINFDEKGNRTDYPIERKSMYTRKINQYYSEVKFAFPQVKAGSIIEYSYRSVKKHYGGLKDWPFQERLPVYTSSFELRPSPNLEFTYLVQKSPRFQAIVKPSASTNSIYFEMDSLPGLGDEPYMDAREDYLQEVRFTITKYTGFTGALKYMTDWNEVAKELWSSPYLGGEMRSNLREPQALVALAVAGKTDLEKMKIIYDFVRSNTEWNGIYSRDADEGVRTTWSKKTGNSGCINTLLLNLLRSADLDAYPLMVSERGNGRINVRTPFINQFDNVYAAVIINGKNYYLDATDDYSPAWMIPSSILNTTALLVRKFKGELIHIEEPELEFRKSISISSRLSSTGNLSADVLTTSKDYARQQQLSDYNKGKDKYIENYLKRGLANVTIDSLEVMGADNDSMNFTQKFKFSTQVQNTGDYAFLGLNMFTGFEENPFILRERFSNINFGYKRMVTLNMAVKVPPDWTIDALPKNIRMINSDTTVMFSRLIQYNSDISLITARIQVELKRSFYVADEYPELKEFFKQMTSMLNEQVVFKTK